MGTNSRRIGERASPDVILHLALLGDALQNIDLGPGDIESALIAVPRNQWRLTVLHPTQLLRPSCVSAIPDDATHIVISLEGGWAIATSQMLEAPASSVRDALGTLAAIADQFEGMFTGMVAAARETGLPCVICTMVPARFARPEDQRVTSAALAIFNDRVLSCAFGAGLPLVDLRLVCNEDADFATETLLSRAGVRKAANAIRAALYRVSRPGESTRVYF